jgi:hypothetical protein
VSQAKTLHIIQDGGAVTEMARRCGGGKLGGQLRPQVRCPDVSGAIGRLLLFQVPVGGMHKTAPRRIAGIRPAETLVQQVLESIPHGAACQTRRVDIEAPQDPVGSRDPAGNQEIDLKSAEMRMAPSEGFFVEPR